MYTNKNTLIGDTGVSLNDLANNQLKFANVRFIKTANQSFSSNSYDNVINRTNILEATGLENVIYLNNGIPTFTSRVKKIDITADIYMSQSQPNFRFDFGQTTGQTFTILYSQSQYRNLLNYSVCPTQAGYIKLSPYQSGTIYGDTMWTWMNVSIIYI